MSAGGEKTETMIAVQTECVATGAASSRTILQMSSPVEARSTQEGWSGCACADRARCLACNPARYPRQSPQSNTSPRHHLQSGKARGGCVERLSNLKRKMNPGKTDSCEVAVQSRDDWSRTVSVCMKGRCVGSMSWSWVCRARSYRSCSLTRRRRRGRLLRRP